MKRFIDTRYKIQDLIIRDNFEFNEAFVHFALMQNEPKKSRRKYPIYAQSNFKRCVDSGISLFRTQHPKLAKLLFWAAHGPDFLLASAHLCWIADK